MSAVEESMRSSDMREAYASALRISACAAAIFPTDRQLFDSYHEAVVPELIRFALHGRRVMEAFGVVDTPVADWGFWPTSRAPGLSSKNLNDSFGHILHSTGASLGWERFEGAIDAYKGRECRYLGNVSFTSEQGTEKFAVGAMAASFLCGVTGQINRKTNGAA
jgi:hypothetical protein